MATARPYTPTQWQGMTRAQKKGFANYQGYLNWWNRNVRPKFSSSGGGAGSPFPGFLTPEQQRQEATSIVELELGPQRAELERQRKQAQANALAQQEANRISTQAYAQGLSGLAPHVQGIYRQAAGDQAALAKGYSGNMQQLQENAAAQTNAELQRIGAPEGQFSNVDAEAANVLYGTGGVIPAETMGREGAAWTAHAASMPAFALGQGAEFAKSIAATAAQEDKTFGEKLLELEQQRPGLIEKALSSLKESQSTSQSNWISQQYLLNTLRQTGASITGIDPYTGKPTYTNAEAQADDAYKAQQDAAKAAAKVAAGKVAGRKAKTAAFSTARQNMVKAVEKTLITTPKNPLTGQPGKKQYPSYEKAREYLWNNFGAGLMGYATGSGKTALKKQIMAMIDQILAAQGIVQGMARNPTKPTKYGPPPKKR